MRSKAGWKQYVSDIAFWLQLALSTVAATILFSSAGAQVRIEHATAGATAL